MRILDLIGSVPIIETFEGVVIYIAGAQIDADGSGGNPHGDPCFQSDTTLHYKGEALNAYEVPFVVVPPVIIKKTKGIVMGCYAIVTNFVTGQYVKAVVADIGPKAKIGEISVAAAKAIGIPWNPNTGGTQDKIVGYELHPGIPAKVNGVLYDLQAA